MKQKLLTLLLALFAYSCFGQDISLYQQFNGRYDFTFVGNTLNPSENNITPTCTINTSSWANLNLAAGDNIVAAYLYWAGSGTGDFDILLNGQPVTQQRNFPLNALNTDGQTRAYFSAFADVTAQVQATGNGTYTVSELDLTAWITDELYCGIKTNFGGWAIIVFYENASLPLNQLNLYDGLQYVPTAINITLPSLNVVDNVGAKIGFVAWEGDAGLAITESLTINGNILSNGLNPADNAFNGTNTEADISNMYNMDLDVYDIQDNVSIGDESAEITLQSGQDFVMVNAIVTKLNSQLPDATVAVDDVAKTCGSRIINVDYTVSNVNSTDVLPAGTTVGFYINGSLVATAATTAELPIGGSEGGTINITVPNNVPADFELMLIADHNFNVTETDETNNSFTINESLLVIPTPNPADITICEDPSAPGTGVVDFSEYEESLKQTPSDSVRFFPTLTAAQDNTGHITNLTSYPITASPTEIWVRVQTAEGCIGYGSFLVFTDDCQFPDARVIINGITQACDSRTITVQFTVTNTNSVDVLPAGTTVAAYANSTFLGVTTTTAPIPVGGSQPGTITVTIPTAIPLNFNLILRVDHNNQVEEINESNNAAQLAVTLWASPVLPQIHDITGCETFNGSGVGTFDFSAYAQTLRDNPADVVTFHPTLDDAIGNTAGIDGPEAYLAAHNTEIFVRLTDANGCYDTGSFRLLIIDCYFPDGVVQVNNIAQACDSRTMTVSYTIGNPDSFDILPAGTQIAVYANATLIATLATTADIPIDGSENGTVTLTIPASIPLAFNLLFVVDDNGTGTGSVVETIETNNSFTQPANIWISPVLTAPADMTACETFNNSGVGLFDFSAYEQLLMIDPNGTVTFHTSQDDANTGDNDIEAPEAYTSTGLVQEIYVRHEDVNGCFDTTSFTITAVDCYFPDATITIDDIYKQCNSRLLHVHYTVHNTGSADILPAGTPVSIYVNGQFLDYTETVEEIAIGESESGFILLTIPIGVPLDFDLTFVADDTGEGTGIIVEADETNNSFTMPANLVLSPVLQQPADIVMCDKGFGLATFDFSAYAESLKNYPDEIVTFYLTQQNADQDIDRIYNASQFTTTENPQRIYVRLFNGTCHTTASFLLTTKKCPPVTYNYVTPNNDGYNDNFFVEGLRNVFLNFKMTIYNRWGNLVWTGDHGKADWDGLATVEKVGPEGTTVPVGTYYFVLELNEPGFPEPIVGWVYVTK
ncbi:CARDB domain-containing protein [uncultured Flavobacterium sp.]|uniref:CARDB domain-containing protein n=1 Tax=uncultured Flavobacterium sp. TaxID=165435 RepID=UPI0025FE0C88|nr:CARDB domain-containing protein [uncultured Flavobacterium sp.]